MATQPGRRPVAPNEATIPAMGDNKQDSTVRREKVVIMRKADRKKDSFKPTSGNIVRQRGDLSTPASALVEVRTLLIFFKLNRRR